MPALPGTSRSRRRPRHRTILLLTILLLLLTGVGMLLAATCRPAWYAPATVNFATLHEDKRQLVALLDGIAGALNAGHSLRVVIDEAQANRWLAARDEMWPDATLELGPLNDPVVAFEEGDVRIGALLAHGTWRGVLSVRLRPVLSGEEVGFTIAQANLGALRIPAGMGLDVVGQVGGLSRGGARLAGPTLWWPNAGVWPNGRRPFRVTACEVRAGRLVIELAPR